MEYIKADTLSEVWQKLPAEDKEDMVCQVAKIMRTMRTKTAFSRIGGIGPDVSCPLVHRVNVAGGSKLRLDFHSDSVEAQRCIGDYRQSWSLQHWTVGFLRTNFIHLLTFHSGTTLCKNTFSLFSTVNSTTWIKY